MEQILPLHLNFLPKMDLSKCRKYERVFMAFPSALPCPVSCLDETAASIKHMIIKVLLNT